MASRLAALLPRLLALTVIWLLGTATYTVAAGGGSQEPAPQATQAAPKRPQILEVPDVRRQAYVFAKGILQDAGFAWSVEGSVRGYAANTVISQRPAPGTRVVDNGAPTVVVRLARNTSYSERGLPENSSPYAGTAIVLASTLKTETPEQPPAPPAPPAPQPQPPAPQPQPAAPQPQPQPQEGTREPDFVVPGAPKEPVDEMRLPQRAKRLANRVADASKPTKQLVNFWLYQHSWIVFGARYGWADGDEALRILIRVDESLQRRWDFGARSERVARRALAYVESRRK
jgi:PASTA domain